MNTGQAAQDGTAQRSWRRTRARGPQTRETVIRSLARLRDSRKRNALLARTSHLHDGDFVRQLQDEAMHAARVDLARAERLVHAAGRLSRQLDDPVARARSLRAQGHVLSLRGRYRQALTRYNAALELLATPDSDLERAITLSGGLQTLIYIGDYARALEWANEAHRVFAGVGDVVRLARLDVNVGNILYRQDRFREALAVYLHAHDALTRVGTAQDVGVVLRNIAVCWISLNDFSEALTAHEAAHAWCSAHDMPLLAAEADYNIAYLHYLRGEYARSIELYQAARVYCQRVGDRYHQALCDLDQSEMYLEINLNEEGGELARQAYRAFRALGTPYEMGKARLNMAVAAARAGDSARALRLFDQAHRLFRHERNHHWVTVTNVYRALVLFESGQTAASRRLAQSALAHFREYGPPGKAALCELLLARIEFRAGRPDLARTMAEDAIVRADRAEATALAAQGYFVLGEIHEALDQPEAAYAAYRQAHAGLETLRSRIAGQQLKIAFLADKGAVYESLVTLALAREPQCTRAAVAFRYIEQAKSRSLADVMAFGPPSPGAPARTNPAARRVIDLRKELTWWQRKLDVHEAKGEPEKRAPGVRALRQQAHDCEIRLARAQAELDLADAEFCMLGNGTTLPLATIRSAIAPGTVVLEYYEARGSILASVLTRDGLEIVSLAESSRIRPLLRLLQFQISKFRLDRRYAERFAPVLLPATHAHLYDLHQALIQPLIGHLPAQRLVIVPHGFLHYLPFHALFDGTQFLIDRVPVSYAPSVTVYYLCRNRVEQPGPHSLVLGVPDPRAPQILDEVRAVSAALPDCRVYLGAQATDRRLREEGRTARYVHVATHGFFRQDNPMFSSVRLGNGALSLLDLYQLRLSADLVTLSGCGTGLSAIVGGDELLGLARGLLYAGARSVLVTLWDVNDRSTATFMRSFYQHMKASPDKGRAFTAAMQEVREMYPHPYFWAPFALLGDPHGCLYQEEAAGTLLLTGTSEALATGTAAPSR